MRTVTTMGRKDKNCVWVAAAFCARSWWTGFPAQACAELLPHAVLDPAHVL